jgi:hypothetical protein
MCAITITNTQTQSVCCVCVCVCGCVCVTLKLTLTLSHTPHNTHTHTHTHTSEDHQMIFPDYSCSMFPTCLCYLFARVQLLIIVFACILCDFVRMHEGIHTIKYTRQHANILHTCGGDVSGPFLAVPSLA